MSLTPYEESPGGSHTELEEIHCNQPKSTAGSGMTAVSPPAVADQIGAQAEDFNERNGEESAKYPYSILYRGLSGVSTTGGSQPSGNEEEKIEEDMEFTEVNFSKIFQELTMKKMWYERTWLEVLKHFAITLIISVLPTLFDVGTDINAGMEYLDEGDTAWGLTTLVIIFFPGLFFSVWIRKAFNISCCKTSVNCMCCLFHPLSPIGYILFPFILVAVKIVGLFNPGPEWKRFTVKITSFEGDFESSLQMLLSLYVVFARAKTGNLPKWWQVAQLVASTVMITKTAIADHLLPKQPMTLKEELKATIKLIPLFLSNCVFKVLSFATSVGSMEDPINLNAFLIFPVAIGLLHLPNLISCCCCVPIGYLTMGSPKHMVKLLVIRKGGRTTRQSMNNLVYNNIWWFVFYDILISFEIGIGVHQRIQELFYVSFGVILFAGYLNVVLIFFQLWRPFKEEEEDGEIEEDIEAGDGLDEEGSTSTCFCISTTFLLGIASLLLQLGVPYWYHNWHLS